MERWYWENGDCFGRDLSTALDVCAGLVKVGGQAKPGASHAVANLGNQFLEGVSLTVVEAGKAVKAALVSGPVGLMPISA